MHFSSIKIFIFLFLVQAKGLGRKKTVCTWKCKEELDKNWTLDRGVRRKCPSTSELFLHSQKNEIRRPVVSGLANNCFILIRNHFKILFKCSLWGHELQGKYSPKWCQTDPICWDYYQFNGVEGPGIVIAENHT